MRRDSLAIAAVVVLRTVPFLSSPLSAISGLAQVALTLFVLFRFGLAGSIVMSVTYGLFLYPITFEASAWYAGGGYFALLLVAAIALYGFRTSLGSRRLLNLPDE